MNKECEKFKDCKVKEITKLPFGLIATFCPDTCKYCSKTEDKIQRVRQVGNVKLKKVA